VHDEELQRVARPEQARTISCHPAADLISIDVGSWFSPEYHAERIPTLAAVLRRYRGRIHLHLVCQPRQLLHPTLLHPRRVEKPLFSCFCRLALQELKTPQDELPDKIVEALTAADWLQFASASADEPFAVPGLTLTSFHIQQLQRLRTVSCFENLR